MSELLQTGERGRELTAEEWKKVDELVDKTGCSYLWSAMGTWA